jgi:hypothetical protein
MGTVRPNIEHIRKLGFFAQAHRWYLEWEKFPACCAGYTDDDINFRCESMNIPKLANNTVPIEVRGSKVNQTGKGEYDDTLTLTLFETVDNIITQFLKEWRDACWLTENGSAGTTSDKDMVEATIIMTLLDNMDQPRWWYKFIGCILESSEPGADPGNDAEPYKPVITIKYDYFNDWGAPSAVFGKANF